ncbi:MAG: tetratricopeptide repeat protein [Pseudomonadota bacterium]
MSRFLTTAAVLALMPMAVFAAGSGSSNPPSPSQTTTQCADGLVFDTATQTCMTPDQSTNDDNAMMEIVRELAYFDRLADARMVLDQLDPSDSMVQTYYGFTARKMGDVEGGMAYYQAALAIDPDNILARSYMGQGLVEMGDLTGAQEQLSEIRARNGRQSWAEVSLRLAIESGTGPSY